MKKVLLLLLLIILILRQQYALEREALAIRAQKEEKCIKKVKILKKEKFAEYRKCVTQI